MSTPFECSDALRTARLVWRRPQLEDAAALYVRVTSDPVVTRYVSWSCHPDVETTLGAAPYSPPFPTWIRA